MHRGYIITRRAASQMKALARGMSSRPGPKKTPPGFVLPPKKLRALVSLYHQSKSFITLENLDEAIDHAFETPGTPVFGHRRVDWPSLRLEVKERERLPKFGLPETLNSTLDNIYAAGYEEREGRVEQVFDAMYGTWQTNKPGLELLQDTWEDVERRLRLKGEKE
jgi:hypothetical protein